MLRKFNFTKQQDLTSNTQLATNESGLSYLLIKNQYAEAAISLFGAHVLHYQAKDKQPLLWMSHTSAQDGSKPFRGGVPICWPWFGPAPAELGSGLPAHGFARGLTWQLEGVSETDDGTFVHLSLNDTAETLAMWPHTFRLEFEVRVGTTLTMSLTTENTSAKEFCVFEALHTYFNTKGTEFVTVKGLGDRFYDKLTKSDGVQEGDFHLTAAVDRIYNKPAKVVTFTTGYDTIKLDNGGENSAVVWNPWTAAENMADFDSDRWQTMVCVETCVTGKGQAIPAGEEHTLSTEISYL